MASPVLAQTSLQGQWDIRTADPSYKGNLLIDSEGRATYDAPMDNGRPAKFFGWVKRTDEMRAQIIVTNKDKVVVTHCIVQSADLLWCHTVRESGIISNGFAFVKVGPGPEHLTPSPSRN